MKNDANAFKKIVDDVLKSIKKKNNSIEAFKKVWREYVGEEAASHASVQAIQNKTAIINIDNPSWLYVLNTKKKKFLSFLATDYPQIDIHDIILRISDQANDKEKN